MKKNIVFLLCVACVLGCFGYFQHIGKVEKAAWAHNSKIYFTGKMLQKEGNYEKAVACYEKLLENPLNEKCMSLCWSYGLCLRELGDYEKSLEYYNLVQKEVPHIVTNENFLFQWAVVLFQNGEKEKAARYLELNYQNTQNPELKNAIQAFCETEGIII